MSVYRAHISGNALWMANQFADMVIAQGPPTQVIDRPLSGPPYIERWMVARKATVPLFVGASAGEAVTPSLVENLYVHRYGRSDPETMHDHPWDNVTLVVSGYYVEETPEGRFLRSAGSIITRQAEDRHRIAEVEPGTISIFGTLQKRREWGFWVEGEFIHWRDFTKSSGLQAV